MSRATSGFARTSVTPIARARVASAGVTNPLIRTIGMSGRSLVRRMRHVVAIGCPVGAL